VVTDETDFFAYREPTSGRLVDLLSARNRFERNVVDERTSVELEGRTVYFPRLEHLVALQLKAARDRPEMREKRDLADVVELWRVAGEDDRRTIEGVLRLFGMEDLW
jgi:hypothetical protein